MPALIIILKVLRYFTNLLSLSNYKKCRNWVLCVKHFTLFIFVKFFTLLVLCVKNFTLYFFYFEGFPNLHNWFRSLDCAGVRFLD